MSATAILERPMVVGFQTSVKDGIIEIPVEYRNAFLEPVFVEIRAIDEKKTARENILELLDKGNEHGKMYGITEEVVNSEIEAYKAEKRNK